MANDNNIKIFTASDIEKYHKGQLSAQEMHAMEKAALDDRFLADAIEGYATPGIQVNDDIADLKKRLAEKTKEAKVIPIHTGEKSSFPWMRVAALIILIAGAALVTNQFLFKSSKVPEIANAPSKTNENAQEKTTDQSTVLNGTKNDTVSGIILFDKTDDKNATTTATGKSEEKTRDLKQTENYGASITDSTVAISGLANNLKTTVPDAPLKNDEFKKEAEGNKTLRNENPADKPVVMLNDKIKSKETARKSDDKDAIAAESYGFSTITRGVSNNNRNNQAYRSNNFFRGRVTDNSNNPLPFANITNTADNVGTYTDAKGNFTLVSPYDSVMNVQVRAIGFENNRMLLRSDVSANQVTLQEDRSMTARILDTVKRNYAIRSREGYLTFEEPEPADGWKSYDSYLANNLNNVPEAYDVKKNTGGDAVELSFEVNKNGDPVNIRVEKSLCDKCDKEAIRLVKEGPKWKRKAKKGKRTTVTVPFVKTD